MLDIDSTRTVLILGMVVAFFVYQQFHYVGGGATTASFLVLMALNMRIDVVLWVFFVSLLSFWLMKELVLRRVALSGTWVFYGMVLISTLLNGIAAFFATSDGETVDWLFRIALFGSFVVPGIIAYDFAHQGFKQTMQALSVMFVVATGISFPVIWLMAQLDPGVSAYEIPLPAFFPQSYIWLESLVTVLVGMALRFRFDMRIGGFVGPVFLLQFLTLEAFVTVYLAALFSYLAISKAGKSLPLTSRQTSYLGLIFGGLVAWASIYWAALLGWQPAINANAFHVAPMLTVGLLTADFLRTGGEVGKVLFGSTITVGATAIVVSLTMNTSWLVAVALLLITVGLLMRKPIIQMRADWKVAEKVGLITRS